MRIPQLFLKDGKSMHKIFRRLPTEIIPIRFSLWLPCQRDVPTSKVAVAVDSKASRPACILAALAASSGFNALVMRIFTILSLFSHECRIDSHVSGRVRTHLGWKDLIGYGPNGEVIITLLRPVTLLLEQCNYWLQCL